MFERWLRQPLFKDEFNNSMERCQRRAEIIITGFKELAAAKLVQLTDCDKEITARQACLDIINMENKSTEKINKEATRKMRPETQEAILKIMADEKESEKEKSQ